MMNVQMSSDITEFESRLLFNMTKRELICLAAAGIFGYFLYEVLTALGLGLSPRVIIPVIVASPILAIGWIKPFNMPLETFIFKCFLPFKLNPTKRVYNTVGLYKFPDKEKLYKNIPKSRMRRKERLAYVAEVKKYGGKR